VHDREIGGKKIAVMELTDVQAEWHFSEPKNPDGSNCDFLSRNPFDEFQRYLPRHEISRIVHPFVRHEKSRAKAQFLQQRGNEGPMRFHCIIECEHNQFVRD